MSPSRLEPSSPEIEELFSKERQYPPQPGDVRTRALFRARKSIASASPPPRSIFSRPASLWIAAAPVVAFAALAFASLHPFASRSVEVPSESSRMNAPPAQRALTAPPPPASPASLPEPSSLEKVPAPLEATDPAAKRPSPAVDARAVELRLLQRARAAVASGGFATALALIADYERRFPAGNFREECQALRVKSLAGLGRNDEARRAAESFREHFPRSVLRQRIEETAKQSQ